jgi:hypothetical protein
MIAGMEFYLRSILERDHTEWAKADWEAWQTAKGDTYDERMTAYGQAMHKVAMLHREADRYLTGTCKGEQSTQKGACEFATDEFRLAYWAALHGDIYGQRLVAECFSERHNENWHCEGVVPMSAVNACTWGLISSDAPGGKATDAEACDDLSASDKRTAFAQAAQLFPQIYHRPLPRR